MPLLEKLFRFERFNMGWQRLMMQGVIILCAGVSLALASAFRPDGTVLFARDLSWLPVSGMVLLALGLVECLDTLLAKELRDFYQNLQVGVLDTVVGGLIILSVAETAERLSLMIAAFLIARGIVRIALVHALRLPQTVSISVCGVVSIILGVLIWLEWPTMAGWFIALCLNIEIAFRGWAILMFALWVKKQDKGVVMQRKERGS